MYDIDDVTGTTGDVATSDDENEAFVSCGEEASSSCFSDVFGNGDDKNRDGFLGSVKSAFTTIIRLFRRSTSKPWHVNSNRTFEDFEETLWERNSAGGKNRSLSSLSECRT